MQEMDDDFTSYFCDYRKCGLPDTCKNQKPENKKVKLSNKTGKNVLDELKDSYMKNHVKRFDFQYG